MAKMTEPKELLVHELGDLLYAERRFLTATKKLAREANDPMLKQRIEQHVQETEQQIERLQSAFEAIGEYEALLHGEAVAAGMRCAMQLAVRLGRVDEATYARQESLLDALGLLIEPLEADGEELLRLMYRDKKVAAGKLRFVLPDRIGHVELVSGVPEAEVLASLEV